MSTFAASESAYSIDTIRFPSTGHPDVIKKDYYLAMLKLALKKSEKKYGPYQLTRYITPVNQVRSIHLLMKNENIDVLWTMTSIEREQLLLPIRIPLVKGGMGCRILLIRKGEQALFDKVENSQQLKQMVAGQGITWPDTNILRYNGYRVETASVYSGVFNMLLLKRTDYLPRSLHEPWDEVKLFPELVVENKLLLEYPSPFYFFVNKVNVKLAKRLKEGLKIALEDGSFEALFNTHNDTKNTLKKADIKNRKVFKLENPYLTEETKALFSDDGDYPLNCVNL